MTEAPWWWAHLATSARRVASRSVRSTKLTRAPSPAIVWLSGFMSDMTSTKVGALSDWAYVQGYAMLRFDYSGHGQSGGAFDDGTISRWLEEAEAVLARTGRTHLLIGAAAVADFRPEDAAAQKIKKTPGQEGLTLHLVRNPDILGQVAEVRAATGWPRMVIGFAAETQDLLANAGAKLRAKRLDLIVANDVTEPGSGFGSDDNRVTLLFADGRQAPLPAMSKLDVARRVLAAALEEARWPE